MPETTGSPIHPTPKRGRATATRSLSLFGASVIGIALCGYLVGIVGGNRMQSPPPPPNGNHTNHGNVPAAVAYSAIEKAGFSPNADWSSHIAQLKQHRPSRFDRVVRTHEMKLAAIADRATNRAFDGAPPVIPHKVEQQSAASCLVCHGEGMTIGTRIATKISHAPFTGCTQCHVESSSSGPFDAPQATENGFVGLYRSGPGARAWGGAPPTIPHSTWLREDCMSCHGTVARPGLRTTHPWLNNCTQCHAPSAELDQSGLWTDYRETTSTRTVVEMPIITPR